MSPLAPKFKKSRRFILFLLKKRKTLLASTISKILFRAIENSKTLIVAPITIKNLFKKVLHLYLQLVNRKKTCQIKIIVCLKIILYFRISKLLLLASKIKKSCLKLLKLQKQCCLCN